MASKSAPPKKTGSSRRSGNGGEKGRLADELNDRITVLEKSKDPIEPVPIAIYEIDRHGPRFKSVNDYLCQATGYAREELLAMDPFSLLDTESKARLRETIEKQLAGEKTDSWAEYRGKAKDGHDMRWLLSVNGTAEGATVVGQDIGGQKRAEEELKASNRKINEIMASIQDDFYVLDRDWNFVYASRQFTSRIGKEPKDFIGNNIWEMFPKHLGTVLEENYRAAMDRREVRRFEASGKYTNAFYRMTAYPSAEGITVLGTDITERKRAEERILQLNQELARRVSELQTLFDLVPIGVSISLDKDCSRMSANKTFMDLVGMSPGANISQNALSDEKPGFKAFLHGKELSLEELPMQKAAWTGKPVHGAEFDAVFPDGHVINFYGHASPLFDEQGHVRGAIGAFDDATERKRAENALRESEEKFMTAFHANPAATTLSDVNGRYVDANKSYETLTGYRREELIGRTSVELGIVDAEKRTRYLTDLDEKGFNQDIEFEIRTRSGEKRTVIGNSVSIRLGSKAGYISYVYDITGRKKVEDLSHRLASLVESSEDAIIAKTLEGTITDWNSAAERMFGYAAGEAIGMNISMLVPPGCLDETPGILHKIGEGEAIEHYETVRQRKDGTLVDVSISVSPIKDRTGRIVGASSIKRDITARKLAEKELWESRAKLAAVFSSMNDGVGIVDTAGGIIEINNALARYHRFRDKAEYMRAIKSLGDYNGILSLYTPDGRPLRADEWPIRRALAGEAKASHELRVERKDTGETWFGSYSFAPVRDQDGKIIAGLITTRDITERKQAEAARELMVAQLKEKTVELQHMYEETEVKTEEMAAQAEELECANEELRMNNEELQKVSSSLHEAQDYLESLINYANAPIIVWNPGFVVTRFNHAFERLSGYTSSEMIGKDLRILFPPDSRAESLDKIKKTLEGEHWESVEIPILHKYGSIRIALWNSANIYGSDNALVATIAQGQDITSRKQAEKDLEEAKAQAELYLDLMSHDISNLHQIIMMQLELAGDIFRADGCLKSGDMRLIDTSMRTLDKAAKLIDNVRKLQKLRGGEFGLEVVDLSSMLQEAIKTYANVPGRDIRINFNPRPGNIAVANPLLKDVLGNLLDNAVKHSDGPLEICVDVHRVVLHGTAYYRVTIEDNGNGIPDEKKEEVFQRFLRGHTKAKGTGLGLYLVKSLVEGFGGYVEIQNRVLGDHTKGTRFLVYLPVAGEGKDAGG